MVRRSSAAALVAVALAHAATAAAAPAIDPLAAPARSPAGGLAYPNGDPLLVYVLTFGPGDHPFLKFGHDALWIRDLAAETDRVYNFGTFRFDSPRLIFTFLGGRMMYWLSVSSLPVVLEAYRHENRTIDAQLIDLPPEAKRALQAALVVNARPENSAYKYDYFLDNCSTRVRDALARVGATFPDRAVPGRFTLREHALRMAAESVPFYVALDLVLGPRVDRPTDRWGETFLPAELARALDVARVSRTEGAVVSGETRLFAARRPPPREAPPRWGAWFLLAGAGVGASFFALGAAGRRWRALRILFGAVLAAWGLVTGFVGCFLVYVWAATDHVVAHRNHNILLCTPWAIALVVLGVGVAAGRPGAIRKASVLARASLAAALLAAALRVTPWFQANGTLIAFFLPVWLGVAAALARLQAIASPSAEVVGEVAGRPPGDALQGLPSG
jgi:hypothetical protein